MDTMLDIQPFNRRRDLHPFAPPSPLSSSRSFFVFASSRSPLPFIFVCAISIHPGLLLKSYCLIEYNKKKIPTTDSTRQKCNHRSIFPLIPTTFLFCLKLDPCYTCGQQSSKIQERFSTLSLVNSCNANFGADTVKMPGKPSSASSVRAGSLAATAVAIASFAFMVLA